jgi:hypothetical protein
MFVGQGVGELLLGKRGEKFKMGERVWGWETVHLQDEAISAMSSMDGTASPLKDF